jgi:hypothetical protein
MSGDSMTANHVEHEIATFSRITGRSGPAALAVKREAEEEWSKRGGDDDAKNSLHFPRRYVDT